MTHNPNPSPELRDADRRLREVKRMATHASDNIRHELNRDPNWSPQRADYKTLIFLLQNIASTTGPDAALSPQTLPQLCSETASREQPALAVSAEAGSVAGSGAVEQAAPGEVERYERERLAIARALGERFIARGNARVTGSSYKSYDEMPYSYTADFLADAEAVLKVFTPTVAAANDEGVSKAIEAAAKIAEDLASIAERGKNHPQPLAIDSNEAWRRVEDACRDIAAAIRLLSQNQASDSIGESASCRREGCGQAATSEQFRTDASSSSEGGANPSLSQEGGK